MVRKFRIGLSLMLATSVFTGAVPARGPQPEKAAFGNAMFRADMTYTEEGSIKIRDPKKPKDTDDSDFTLRINATFSRAVQMTNDGSGMTLAECMEWNPDGGCKVYSPLSYGGSVVYGTTATLHSEHYPPELPDVTTFNTKANFSGVLLPESSATMSEENFTAIAFDLHVGMKGDCEFSMLRNWTAV